GIFLLQLRYCHSYHFYCSVYSAIFSANADSVLCLLQYSWDCCLSKPFWGYMSISGQGKYLLFCLLSWCFLYMLVHSESLTLSNWIGGCGIRSGTFVVSIFCRKRIAGL